MKATINKHTLSQICDHYGVTNEYLALRVKCTPEQILQWKSSHCDDLPSMTQAKVLAKSLRIPLASLYFEPANFHFEKLPRLTNKRAIGEGCVDDFSIVNLAVLDLLNLRSLVLEIEEHLKIQHNVFNISIDADLGAKKYASTLRHALQISRADQKAAKSPRQFFLLIRQSIERLGVLVAGFSGVDVSVLRGIAVSPGKIPVIGFNEEDSYSAKSFTLIHELVHIISHQSVACNDFASFAHDSTEVFCNSVAGNFLVPEESLLSEKEIVILHKEGKTIDVSDLRRIASRYSVSREVITRRMFDLGLLTQDQYDAYVATFAQQLAERRAKQSKSSFGGRDMGRALFDKNGYMVTGALFAGVNSGLYSTLDVSDFLGTRIRNVNKVFGEYSG